MIVRGFITPPAREGLPSRAGSALSIDQDLRPRSTYLLREVPVLGVKGLESTDGCDTTEVLGDFPLETRVRLPDDRKLLGEVVLPRREDRGAGALVRLEDQAVIRGGVVVAGCPAGAAGQDL